MTFTAQQIALMIQGRVEGNDAAAVSSFGKIEEAGAGQLSFLANPKYEEYLYSTGASVVIVNETLELKQPVSATLIRVADAYNAFANLLARYQQLQLQQLEGQESPNHVGNGSTIGENCYLGAFSYIGNHCRIGNQVKIYPQVYIGDHVVIGDHTVLLPGVKIYSQCQVGSHCLLHAGVVVGADGFGFAPQPDGSYQKVPQIGNVVIEDHVEIGANSTIDRATIGSTLIHSGTKIDNLVQIAHNVEVGNHTVIAAQAGISGSTKVGNRVLIGGQAGIVGHIRIGDGARINAQSGVTKSLEDKKTVTGSPAYDYTAALRSQAISRKLPDLEKKIQALEARLATLNGLPEPL